MSVVVAGGHVVAAWINGLGWIGPSQMKAFSESV